MAMAGTTSAAGLDMVERGLVDPVRVASCGCRSSSW